MNNPDEPSDEDELAEFRKSLKVLRMTMEVNKGTMTKEEFEQEMLNIVTGMNETLDELNKEWLQRKEQE